MKTGDTTLLRKEHRKLYFTKGEKMKRTIWLAAAILLAVGINASAGMVTLDLGYVFDGGVDPSGPAPWITAVFDDGGTAGTVDLTITAALDADLDQKVGEVLFNLDPDLDPSALTIEHQPGEDLGVFGAPTVLNDPTATEYPADGGGYYDILIEFLVSNGDEFNGTDSVSFSISGIPSLTAESFNFLAEPHGGNGIYAAAAHIQGLGPDNGLSSWVGVPEPATMFILGLGSVLLRKRRKV